MSQCTIQKILPLVSRSGARANCSITLTYIPFERARLEFECEAVRLPYEFECPSVFHCVYAFRRALEESGWILCCNISRVDARVMGMLGDVTGGLRCYLLKSAPKGLTPRVVDMFEEAPVDECATIAEQENFFSSWRTKPTVDQASN
jgi:hypothetical protein